MSSSSKSLAQLSTEEKRALLALRLKEKVGKPHSYPLSFAQQRLWFLDQLAPGNSFYNISVALPFTIFLDVEAFRKSINDIVRRHGSLRTTFRSIDGKPAQLVAPILDLPVPLVDLSGYPKVEQEEEAKRLATEEARQPFDLSKGPLIRTSLLRLGPINYIFLVTMHHIISDGWSLNIFFRELSALYAAYTQGKPSPLPELPIQYPDYAVWQRQWLQGDELETQLAFWKKQLQGLSVLQLPTDRPRPAIQTFEGASYSVEIPAFLRTSLKVLSQREGVTLFMTLLAAFQILLHRYAGQDDIVVGAPIAGRSRPELEDLIGFFVNTLVLRSDLSGNPTFREFLARVREMALNAYANQDLPFERLVDELKPERDLSRNPLCQVAFQLQHVHESDQRQSRPGARPLQVERGTAPFDVLFSLWENADGIRGGFDYNTDLFDATTIARIASHFHVLLEGIVSNPDARVSDLPLLTSSERQQLLQDWNATQADYPKGVCFHQVFEAWATQTPQAIAVQFQDQQITYQELNRRVNQLAHHLRKIGVGPEVLVGLCVERSVEMVVGLLGVLKAGGAYLPLDPAYPKERLAFMLADSGASVLLTQEKLISELPAHRARLVCLDSDWEVIARQTDENPPNNVTVDHLAYVIYTSGSTGKPKGTLLEHRGLCNVAEAQVYSFGIGPGSRILQFSSLSFDASTFEMVMAFYSGASLCLGMQDTLMPGPTLIQFLKENGITMVTFPPSALAVSPVENLPQLRTITVAGEACPGEVVANWSQGRKFFNLYGPTEFTIWASIAECTVGEQRPTIGRPIANTKIYLLDRYLNPVPLGVPGEIYLSGVGLARGYLRRPDLTAEKFIPDPFGDVPGARLYRTGDIARYLQDGRLDFLGRWDDQVKIRGYRIELGEIEAVMAQHPAVREARVLVQEQRPGENRLVGYIVADERLKPSTRELRRLLSEKLPHYMIPSAFVRLDTLPITLNGKVDRGALPVPAAGRPGSEEDYAAPNSSAEKKLAEIWMQVLGVGRVGVHDNFFELGGDSILSIQIISRANQAGLKLTPKQLFQNQTIAELAAVAGTAPAIQAEQGIVSGEIPLTPIQHWFLEQQLPDPHHFNQAILLQIPANLHPDWLRKSVRYLILHHDALRMRLVKEPSGWKQFYSAPNDEVPFEQVDLSTVTTGEQAAAMETVAGQIQESLNLEKGPTIRVALFKLGGARASRLLIVIHHLAVDGVSWRILLEDLQTIYGQLSQSKAIDLPQKTTSFKYWAERLLGYAGSGELRNELNDWLRITNIPIPHLPLDFPGGKNTAGSVASLAATLNPAETKALLQDVPQVYNTQVNDVLLSALAQTLSHWTSSPYVLIDLEGHGREDLFEDVELSRTVGWFTTLFPLVLHCREHLHTGDLLKSIKEQLRSVPGRGIGYGVLRYLSPDEQVRQLLGALPRAEVSFNYLGQFGPGRQEPDGFGEARESSGPFRSPKGIRPHLIEIGGSVAGGRLQMEWLYSENVHRRSTVEALAKQYMDVLREIIVYCQSPETGGFTPSDFPRAKVSQTDLDKLLTKINRPEKEEPNNGQEAK